MIGGDGPFWEEVHDSPPSEPWVRTYGNVDAKGAVARVTIDEIACSLTLKVWVDDLLVVETYREVLVSTHEHDGELIARFGVKGTKGHLQIRLVPNLQIREVDLES